MAINRRTLTRTALWLLAAALVGGALAAAFWPRPVLVDLGEVTHGPLVVTIDEEGRTQVHDVYVVSTPVAGRLLRVAAVAGDSVARGDVVAHMRPTNPVALDVRTREQALAAVDAAQAALAQAQAAVNAASVDAELAQSDFERSQALAERGTVSPVALDRARSAAQSAAARLETARAAVAVRQADLANARAQLIGFEDPDGAEPDGNGVEDIPLTAPISGSILQIIQQSETTLPAGTPVLELGDIVGDLEVEVELISSDAVQVDIGDRVVIDDWGGDATLAGQVTRIAPLGITKVSALGVEEQRVAITIQFTDPADRREGLGHGYRVVTRIVVWESPDALQVPQSALFRQGDGWAVFRVADGRAVLTDVAIGPGNGVAAQVTGGLDAGAQVVLYPGPELSDGSLIERRNADD